MLESRAELSERGKEQERKRQRGVEPFLPLSCKACGLQGAPRGSKAAPRGFKVLQGAPRDKHLKSRGRAGWYGHFIKGKNAQRRISEHHQVPPTRHAGKARAGLLLQLKGNKFTESHCITSCFWTFGTSLSQGHPMPSTPFPFAMTTWNNQTSRNHWPLWGVRSRASCGSSCSSC